jgi:hypothetical protein
MRGGHPRRQSQWRANASRRRRASCPQASNSRPGMALPALREVSGGQANLTKPFTQSELESALREILR